MLEPLLLKNPDGNHANLCFVNAVIQILRHNLQFQQHVYFKRSTSDTFTEIFNILRYEGTNYQTSCQSLRRNIGVKLGIQEIYSGAQQDAVEFMGFLFDYFDEDAKNMFCFYTRITTDFFHGQTFPCQHCGNRPRPTSQVQKFLRISFPDGTPDKGFYDLGVLIQRYFDVQYSDEKDGLRCNTCCKHGDSPNHQNDIRCRLKPYQSKAEIIQFAPCLLVQLVRFKNDGNKINSIVKSAERLCIQNTEYRLTGILNHDGTLKQGHYTALLKKDQFWYECNDNNLPRRIGAGGIFSRKNYMFMFEKVEGDIFLDPHISISSEDSAAEIAQSLPSCPPFSDPRVKNCYVVDVDQCIAKRVNEFV